LDGRADRHRVLGSGLTALDGTVVNIALPVIPTPTPSKADIGQPPATDVNPHRKIIPCRRRPQNHQDPVMPGHPAGDEPGEEVTRVGGEGVSAFQLRKPRRFS